MGSIPVKCSKCGQHKLLYSKTDHIDKQFLFCGSCMIGEITND